MLHILPCFFSFGNIWALRSVQLLAWQWHQGRGEKGEKKKRKNTGSFLKDIRTCIYISAFPFSFFSFFPWRNFSLKRQTHLAFSTKQVVDGTGNFWFIFTTTSFIFSKSLKNLIYSFFFLSPQGYHLSCCCLMFYSLIKFIP